MNGPDRGAAHDGGTRRSPVLLDPVRVGRLSLRNRVVVPAHTTNFAVDGLFSARHVAYHRTRAAGGVGLIVTEGMRVHPTSLGRTTTVAAFDDRIVPALAGLADAVHAEGAKLAAQLLHVGRQAGGHHVLTAPWGASDRPWSGTAATPHRMTTAEIAEVVAGFGAAAARVKASGVDAVEVHLGHGHLLQQFLSPATNDRDDEYGGDPDRRLRLAREVLTAVRAATDLPLLLRISGDEFLPGGLGLPEMLDAVGALLAEFPVDVLHVSHSAYVGSVSVATQMADMTHPPMAFRHLPRAFKDAFPGTAVLAVCRVDTLDNAERMVADGDADLVALARPHIAAPDLVARHRDRRAGRDCIACNQGCAGRLELGLPIGCVVNPEVGLEREWAALRTAAADGPRRRVLVVGGGPAGMEAALAAAGVGHRVTLVDAASRLGGALTLAAVLRSGYRLYVDQLAAAVRASGAEVRLNTTADPDLLAEGWDHVVLATGAVERPEPGDVDFPALALRAVVEDPARAGGHAVLVDTEGSTTGLALAELLLDRGSRVTLVTDRPALAWRVSLYTRPALVERLRGRDFSALLMRSPVRVTEGSMILADPLSGRTQAVDGVSSVVFLRPPTALADLAGPLRDLGVGHTVVGDAHAPRSALEAAFDGRLAGLAATGGAQTPAAAAALRGRL
ncbi:oxidoreductase [Actinokineospora spheciospongiae]|uniref:oxidoreductase n=1 Tax=Actinokineospora spheciospongiae TaxID=909613 RepID=UPI0004AF5687|nr:FAD-dependent oxidoreductase [Actinokineospora spheciospongiae]